MRTERIVPCGMPGCERPAEYKIGAWWNDDQFRGLKTYELSCMDHVKPLYEDAEGRWLEYEPVPGETVEELGVFRFEPFKGDRNLERDLEWESILRS